MKIGTASNTQLATMFSRVALAFPKAIDGLDIGDLLRVTETNGVGLSKTMNMALRQMLEAQQTVDALPASPSNIITVATDLTLAQRIKLGRYDGYVKGSIIEYQTIIKDGVEVQEPMFPHDPITIGRWEYDLYPISKYTSSKDVVDGAEVDGWTVAKAEHLLAFGQQFPEVQRKFPAIGLGAVCMIAVACSFFGVMVTGAISVWIAGLVAGIRIIGSCVCARLSHLSLDTWIPSPLWLGPWTLRNFP